MKEKFSVVTSYERTAHASVVTFTVPSTWGYSLLSLLNLLSAEYVKLKRYFFQILLCARLYGMYCTLETRSSRESGKKICRQPSHIHSKMHVTPGHCSFNIFSGTVYENICELNHIISFPCMCVINVE